jgi:hypothetical protein
MTRRRTVRVQRVVAFARKLLTRARVAGGLFLFFFPQDTLHTGTLRPKCGVPNTATQAFVVKTSWNAQCTPLSFITTKLYLPSDELVYIPPPSAFVCRISSHALLTPRLCHSSPPSAGIQRINFRILLRPRSSPSSALALDSVCCFQSWSRRFLWEPKRSQNRFGRASGR